MILDESLSVNGRHPFRISTQWLDPETKQIHVFESESIWFDPRDYIKTDTISVLIKRGNPRIYLVDISFLPKLAE